MLTRGTALSLAVVCMLATPFAARPRGLRGQASSSTRPATTAAPQPQAGRVSGFDFVGRYITDHQNLESICSGKTEAIADVRRRSDASVAAAKLAGDVVKLARAEYASGDIALNMGDVAAAIDAYESALETATKGSAAFPELAATALACDEAIGVAYLRRGELENCAMHHTSAMCIFPISAGGRHMLPSGSQKAIEYFDRYLSQDPKNLEVRWLLNVAHQTLGTYPKGVPAAYLIPPSAFVSKENVGAFVDVAPQLGLDVVGNAGGAIVDDFDNDGLFDIVESSEDPCQSIQMFHNDGDGTFTDVTKRANLSNQLGGINLVQTDYNNDGWLDIFVMRGGWEFPMRNSLLRNDGGGIFTDVTAASGLSSGAFKTHTAAWADFDGDGWVDLFVGHEQAPSQLFRNKHDGTFVDVTATALGGLVAYTKGAAWGDYDNDGYPDLYVSNFGESNLLFHNNGDGTFDEVATELGVESPLRSFPCWFFDYDNDGLLDIFVASYSYAGADWLRANLGLPRQWDSMKLYHNAGKHGFEDVTEKVGLDRAVAAMGANFGDIDNDGFLDMYLGTGSPAFSALMPNLMFRNHGGTSFVDVTTSSGTGHLQKGHAVAFADVDNDGNEDIYENVGGAVLGDKYNRVLFKNPGHANNWISIKLVGVRSNRSAIGAKVKLTLVGAEREGAIRYREVTSGGSFGASPLTLHVGLGSATKIASIEVTWPASKTKQLFTNVEPNQFLEITELDTTYARRKVSPFQLSGRPHGAPHVESHHSDL